jgi:hypothetical protein
MNPHDIRPITDNRGTNQALALRRPVAKLQLDVDIGAAGVEVRDGLPRPVAQPRYSTKLPQHDRSRLTGTRTVVAAASDQYDQSYEQWNYYFF